MSMKQQKSKLLDIKRLFGATTLAVVGTLVYSTTTFAGNAADQILIGADKSGQGSGGTTLESGIEVVTNLLLFVIGIVSVIMIIIGGIRYTTSNGDASQTKAAKDTILYAVVGLIVAIMAYAIVRWVVQVFM